MGGDEAVMYSLKYDSRSRVAVLRHEVRTFTSKVPVQRPTAAMRPMI